VFASCSVDGTLGYGTRVIVSNQPSPSRPMTLMLMSFLGIGRTDFPCISFQFILDVPALCG
jgi:hypothetical protein